MRFPSATRTHFCANKVFSLTLIARMNRSVIYHCIHFKKCYVSCFKWYFILSCTLQNDTKESMKCLLFAKCTQSCWNIAVVMHSHSIEILIARKDFITHSIRVGVCFAARMSFIFPKRAMGKVSIDFTFFSRVIKIKISTLYRRFCT